MNVPIHEKHIGTMQGIFKIFGDKVYILHAHIQWTNERQSHLNKTFRICTYVCLHNGVYQDMLCDL